MVAHRDGWMTVADGVGVKWQGQGIEQVSSTERLETSKVQGGPFQLSILVPDTTVRWMSK